MPQLELTDDEFDELGDTSEPSVAFAHLAIEPWQLAQDAA